MYGTRDATVAWEREWTETVNSVDESVVSHPTLLHSEKLYAFMAQGNDVKTLGDYDASSEVQKKLRAALGAGRDDAKEVRILSLHVRWNSNGERSWIEHGPSTR